MNAVYKPSAHTEDEASQVPFGGNTIVNHERRGRSVHPSNQHVKLARAIAPICNTIGTASRATRSLSHALVTCHVVKHLFCLFTTNRHGEAEVRDVCFTMGSRSRRSRARLRVRFSLLFGGELAADMSRRSTMASICFSVRSSASRFIAFVSGRIIGSFKGLVADISTIGVHMVNCHGQSLSQFFRDISRSGNNVALSARRPIHRHGHFYKHAGGRGDCLNLVIPAVANRMGRCWNV